MNKQTTTRFDFTYMDREPNLVYGYRYQFEGSIKCLKCNGEISKEVKASSHGSYSKSEKELFEKRLYKHINEYNFCPRCGESLNGHNRKDEKTSMLYWNEFHKEEEELACGWNCIKCESNLISWWDECEKPDYKFCPYCGCEFDENLDDCYEYEEI